MKFYSLLTLLCLMLIGGTLQNLQAQDQNDTSKRELVLVITKDGVERTGYILQDDGREILLETTSVGKIYIKKSDIRSITPIDEKKKVVVPVGNGEYRIESPFNTRYYFTTNALPMKKKDYYVMTHLWGPEVHYGATNRFSVGIMSTWFASPFIGAFKYSIPTKNEKVNFGLGTLIGTSGYIAQFKGFGGLHWGMMTYGDRLNNITLSLGYGYFKPGFTNMTRAIPGTYTTGQQIPYEEIAISYKAPVVGLGGILQVGPKASIILDGMLFFGSQSVNQTTSNYNSNTGTTIVSELSSGAAFFYFMPGMRFQNAPNKAFQFALAGVTVFPNSGDSYSFPIPMCSWFARF